MSDTTLLVIIGVAFIMLAALFLLLFLFMMSIKDVIIKTQEKNIKPEAPIMSVQPVKRKDDNVLIAVITAAIAAQLEADPKYAGGFRVVSFRRAGIPWNKI